MVFFCGLDAKKSEVEKSRRVLIIRIGSRNQDDNPVSPDLTSFHSLSLAILIHMVSRLVFFKSQDMKLSFLI